MSKDEIIERVNKFINITVLYGKTYGMTCDDLKKYQQVFQGLLDLYNKEKEKNKFINEIKTIGTDNTIQVVLTKSQYSFLLNKSLNSVSKDKIKEKIMEIQKYGIFIDKDYYFNSEDEYPIAQTEFTKEELEDIVIDKLKELLEEK